MSEEEPRRTTRRGSADRQRAWRRRQGYAEGNARGGRVRTSKCGEYPAGYRWHERHGETICDACRLARNEWQRANNERKRKNQ